MKTIYFVFICLIFLAGCKTEETDSTLFEVDHPTKLYDSLLMGQITIPYSTLMSIEDEEIELIKNTILAKKGYSFNDNQVHEYFSQFKWYKPKKGVSEELLTDYEIESIKNIDFYLNNMDLFEFIKIMKKFICGGSRGNLSEIFDQSVIALGNPFFDHLCQQLPELIIRVVTKDEFDSNENDGFDNVGRVGDYIFQNSTVFEGFCPYYAIVIRKIKGKLFVVRYTFLS